MDLSNGPSPKQLTLIINVLDNVYLAPCVSQFQALPSSPPGNPGQIFKNCQIPAPGQVFCVNSQGARLPLDPQYTFSPYSRPQQLIYPLNIYKLVGRT